MLKLYKFYTHSCQPCKPLGQFLDNLMPNYPEVEYISVDAEVETDLVNRFGVTSVPTVVMQRNERYEYLFGASSDTTKAILAFLHGA